MSSPLNKRLYSVLPRPRTLYSSTTPTQFFDTPPPPPRSPIISSVNRLLPKGEATSEAPPYSLALTFPQHPSNPLFLSNQLPYYQSFASQSHNPSSPEHQPLPEDGDHEPAAKRQRLRYQLDVGGYGIPKGRARGNKLHEDASLAVQVGEDAYFVRDNAMGVADGVGGWARMKHSDVARAKLANVSPSAAFARKLMHYCSSEVAASPSSQPFVPPPPPPVTTSPMPIPMSAWAEAAWRQKSLEEQLADELEQLEEGIDVLSILESAYDQTIKSHVAPPLPSCSSSPSTPSSSTFFNPNKPPQNTPLKVGSSTALLAILDQAPHTHIAVSNDSEVGSDAVIKIAHIGDCMGMLVRGEEIVWRSEEMWWGFNTPVQLGPSSAALPSDAHVFTFPVQEDDILVLASDGLSDNLWDEDILDEIVRFKHAFLDGNDEGQASLLRRRTLAGMLSEALCSRARSISERASMKEGDGEVPFARRAREQGKVFRGGKGDDISVVVALISPAGVE